MKVTVTLTTDDVKSMMSRLYGFKESDMEVKNLGDHIIVECNGFPASSGYYSQPVLRGGFGNISPLVQPNIVDSISTTTTIPSMPNTTTDCINRMPTSITGIENIDKAIMKSMKTKDNGLK